MNITHGDKGYDLLRALGSAFCEITHETSGTICYGHWVLHNVVLSLTKQGVRCVTGIGFSSSDIAHETGGTICSGHWALHLGISHTIQWVRFVTGIGFCILWYHTRNRGYDLLPALYSASCEIMVLHLVISHMRQELWFVTGIGFCVLWSHTRKTRYDVLSVLCSVSCHITHETEGTICYGHWDLLLLTSLMGQGVRFVTGIVFCIFWYPGRNSGGTTLLRALGYHTRDREYDLLQALGSASFIITHGTRGTIGYGYCVLHLLISRKKQRGYDLLRALGSASCDIIHETRGTIYNGHWVLHLVKSQTRQGYDLLRALESASGYLTHTRDRVYGLWVLWNHTRNRGYDLLRHWVCIWWIPHTRQGVRFVTGIGFCFLWNHTRGRGYNLLLALGPAFCDIAYERPGVTICYGHWVLYLDITYGRGGKICYGHWALHLAVSFTRQEVRFVTGIAFCILWTRLRNSGGTICYGHWALRLVIPHTIQSVRFVTGIGFCVLWSHRQNKGYDRLRALCSASSDITNETETTISYEHWHRVLHPAISHTRQGLRFDTGIGFCVWWNHTRDRGYDLLRAVSASCDITDEQGVRCVTGIGFCILWYPRRNSGGTICYEHWVLPLVPSHTRHEVRLVSEIKFCILWNHKRDRGTICYGHWVLHLMISLTHETGRTGCASCEITHETGATICYGHWV